MLTYTLPPSIDPEIDDFAQAIVAFTDGRLTPDEFKPLRVPFGVYEQRARGTYMIRIRATGGIITPIQLAAAAKTAGAVGGPFVHVTTRQEIQIHDVAIEHVIDAIRMLRESGLGTRGGGGNTVRNIMASVDTGVSPIEPFDSTPWIVAITDRLIAEPDSYRMPRKLKMSFANSESDTANATIQDVGFIARIRNGVEGFAVYVAGGMGRKPAPGHLLHDFIPADESIYAAVAIKRLFDTHGNRRNRHTARLRFLFDKLGEAEFKRIYTEEWNRLVSEGYPRLTHSPIDTESARVPGTFEKPDDPASFDRWLSRWVRPQKQQGLSTVEIPILHGLISPDDLSRLAAFLTPLGTDIVRLSMQQNIVLRNIPAALLPAVHRISREISSLTDQSRIAGTSIACAGAATCQLGIARPRGLVSALNRRLARTDIDLDVIQNIRINFSGCPNTCGQHMIADLGFYGKIGRVDGRAYPLYAVVAGGATGTETVRLAKPVAEVPARDLPEFVEDVLRAFSESRSIDEPFSAWVDSAGTSIIQTLADRYAAVPTFDDDPAYFFDWGNPEPFNVEGRGTGECAAGLFDLVDIRIAKLKELIAADAASSNSLTLRETVDTAITALLITKGIEVRTATEAAEAFAESFIRSGLIDSRFEPLVREVAQDPDADPLPYRAEITALAHAVIALHGTLDESLHFAQTTPAPVVSSSAPKLVEVSHIPSPAFDAEKNLTGVACPMNFVKTKMELAKLASGQILKITLDGGAPIENVPRSVAGEGHTILDTSESGGTWTVFIRKA